MIAVHKLVSEDDKEGVEWFGAVVANTLLFRPTTTCKLEKMKEVLAKEEQDIRIKVKRMDREILKAAEEFARLQRKNQYASHIRASAKLLHLKRIGRDRLFEIAYQVALSIQELVQMQTKLTQQECMSGMAEIYVRLCNQSRRSGMERRAIQYELNRDRLNDVHQMFQDAWQSSPDFEGEEMDINEIIAREIAVQKLEMPEVPVYLPPAVPKRQCQPMMQQNIGDAPKTTALGGAKQSTRQKQKASDDADMKIYMRFQNLSGEPPP